jgi:hypothetical protein
MVATGTLREVARAISLPEWWASPVITGIVNVTDPLWWKCCSNESSTVRKKVSRVTGPGGGALS